VIDRSSTYSAYIVPVSTLGIDMWQGVVWMLLKPCIILLLWYVREVQTTPLSFLKLLAIAAAAYRPLLMKLASHSLRPVPRMPRMWSRLS